MGARVAVVIPSWNRLELLVRCLDSLASARHRPLHVVVVDNASSDGTAAAVRERYPLVTVLCNRSNLGYAGGNNAGIRWAMARGADYVLLVNNDARVPPALVEDLLHQAESDTAIAACGSRNLLIDRPECLWGAYGRLTYGPFVAKVVGDSSDKVNRPVLDAAEFRRVMDVDWVIGNGALLRCAAVERVGLLREDLFAYHEDVDWCLRARRAGYRIVYVGTAAILHSGGSSSDERHGRAFPREYFLGRNGVLFVKRHASAAQALRFAMLSGGAAAYRWLRAGVLCAWSGEARERGRRLWRLEKLYRRGVRDALLDRPVPFAELGLSDCAIASASDPPPQQIGPDPNWT